MALPNALSAAQRIRLIFGPILLSSLLWPSFYQSFLDTLWNSLCYTSFYKWSTFETLWTVFLYAAIEGSLTIVFMNHPEWRFTQPRTPTSKPRGMRRPSRRIGEGLVYIAPLLAMDLTMIKKFADVELSQMLVSGNYDISSLYLNTTSSSNATLSFQAPPKTYLIPTLHNFTLTSPLQTTRALPLYAPSSRRLVTELILSFFIYDTLFFAFHLSLHYLPLLRSFHLTHHSHPSQIHPQITNQLSLFERLGLVMLANFSLNVIGAHVLTRTVFVVLFVWLLVEIHCGMSLPWGYEKVMPRGWGGGAGKHMRHHVGGGEGYEPFFCWWDGVWERVVRGMGEVK
ncbi:hypothetical protein BCR34DRAFT_593231 [Clohesyomyces aquaticus]|uniref:Fatty acid hydroxylase domain-containing protein n=1 Tax=Clohesyomyces aquaticus TaxID=1231657 RepID=A0A1Y1YJY7_9PLEO|nr:hypothetical protein BCR34DRAFT_593231 [Clohesyomyces aquaticus]